MKLTPIKVFVAYALIIITSALMYFFLPGVFKEDISFGDGLYFSVVTITTLGYGDLSPISGFGKTVAAFEALLGVILMGVFLLAVSNQLIEKEERKRINAAKENLKAQYAAWKHDILYSLLFLVEPNKGVDSKLPKKLMDVHEYRNYFKENNVDFIKISYEQLCFQPLFVLNKIFHYVNLSSNFYSLNSLPNTHIAHGNRMKKNLNSKICYDNQWFNKYWLNTFLLIVLPFVFYWNKKHTYSHIQ